MSEQISIDKNDLAHLFLDFRSEFFRSERPGTEFEIEYIYCPECKVEVMSDEHTKTNSFRHAEDCWRIKLYNKIFEIVKDVEI